MHDYTVKAESRLGTNAVKAEKTLCGEEIDVIGYANDTSGAHTIGLSQPLFLKMVCAVYLMVSMDIKPDDDILVYTLQSFASCAIRSGCGVGHGTLLTRIFVVFERGALVGHIREAFRTSVRGLVDVAGDAATRF